MARKVSLGVDKAKWRTSPLPGHIVLVSTASKARVPNVAPKSWMSMVSRRLAVIGFGCNLSHQTARNILETKEFVINVPGRNLVQQIWKCGESEHGDATKIRKLGFTLVPSVAVDVPRVDECRAHFECIYDSDRQYADEIWFFGKIVFACVDEKALEGSRRERYRYLDPILYLEEKTYGTLGWIGKVKP